MGIKIFLMSILFTSMLHAQEVKWKVVEQIKVDLNGDGKNEEITLDIPEGWKDPGEFTRMTFKTSAGEKQSFSDISGLPWTFKDGPKNLVKSKYLFVFGNPKHPILVFQEYAYASMPGILQIYEISKDQQLKNLFKEEFDLRKIMLKPKGQIQFYGLPSYSQCVGNEKNETCSYDPKLLYDIKGTTEHEVVLNEPESKKMNLAEGYVWHGPKYSEKIQVPIKINNKRK